ncbi:hypothetical protein BC834DRAFT_973634 [Gloeopeniophorella convolvens]|nr:hypothetical protein BC834DRAFT_973634 [Gloeopeniophorella convolvens]
MGTNGGNTISAARYPESGDVAVLYHVKDYIRFWPRIASTAPVSIKSDSSGDNSWISETLNIAATLSVKGKSIHIFVQEADNGYLQEIILKQGGGGGYKFAYHPIRNYSTGGRVIPVLKGTSIAVMPSDSTQLNETKKEEEQFGCIIFFQAYLLVVNVVS